MAGLKFFQIGKANEEITRLETLVAAKDQEIAQLKTSAGGNDAEIAAEAERLSGVNAGLTAKTTELSTENSILKTQLTAAQADAAAAKAELKVEKDSFEGKCQSRVQAAIAAGGHPPKPEPGKPGAKTPTGGELTGLNRILAACKRDRMAVTGETE